MSANNIMFIHVTKSGSGNFVEIADFVIVENKNVLRVNTNERVMSGTNLGLF